MKSLFFPGYTQNTQPTAYAYIQAPQQAPPPQGGTAPPPQMYVPAQMQAAPAPQPAQYQPQPAYATSYQPAPSGYPQTGAPAAQATAQMYQSQPPIYYAPPQAPPPQPVVTQQRVTRRPTNAIPILAPPDRKEVLTSSAAPNEPKDKQPDSGAENIDHIIDNMFVRRPPIQPAAAAIGIMKSATDPNSVVDAVKVSSLWLKNFF